MAGAAPVVACPFTVPVTFAAGMVFVRVVAAASVTVTFTVTLHDPFAGMLPPVRRMAPSLLSMAAPPVVRTVLPVPVTIVPAQEFAVTRSGNGRLRPMVAAMLSVTARALVANGYGLVTVMVRAVTPPAETVVGEKDLLTFRRGGETTSGTLA